jgi:hypothetical protein
MISYIYVNKGENPEVITMMDISETQARFSALIESRANSRSVMPVIRPNFNTPLRALGENLLNKFAYQLAEQRESIMDDLLENIVTSLALAGMIGIDLETELANLLNLLESVSAEAA